jgi:tetratricopeptide (TPR) repeat protein
MDYRPVKKRRHPALTLIFSVLLVVMMVVLVVLLGIRVGYLEVEVPSLAERFGPTPTPTRPAVLYIADGDAYFAEGKLKEAVDAYERAIQIEPGNDIAYIRQSRLLIYTGDTARAVERAAQAVLLNPTSPENLAYYCRALDWEAQYGAAFDACSCAIELAPDYAEGYAFLAEVYADQGDWFSARATAQQAIDTNFQSLDAHHNMGYVLEIQGRYREAVDFYENAITLAPNLAPLYVAAGRSYYWLGDFESATDRFKEAIKLSPTDPEAYDRLGWTYHTNGQYTQAIDALEQSIGVDPTYDRAWGHLGLVYYTRQNFETAIELLPKAIELAEGKFLRRARQVEIHTEVQTLTGPEFIPVLRGRFAIPNNLNDVDYIAELQPVSYTPRLEIGSEESSCAASIVQSIQNAATLPGTLPAESLDFTQVFSRTTGTASLNLATGNLLINISNMPQPETTPYEIKVKFWPNRIDSVGYVQPDGNQNIRANIQFEEKLSAPIEYYYTLGLAYIYLDPSDSSICEQAVPWLLTALEKDSSAYNPAWAGLRICPSSSSPPTPIPTPTPLPEEEE